MKELLRRELWRCLLSFCLLTAAAAWLWPRLTWTELPLWVPGALALWCLLLLLSRRFGVWGPAALCLVALCLALLLTGKALRESSEIEVVWMRPAILPLALLLLSLLLCYAPDRFSLRAGLALAWLGLWLWAALGSRSLPRLTVTAMLPLPLLAAAEARFRWINREQDADFAPLRSGLCLALVLAAALTLPAPAPAKPYDYPLLRAMASKAESLWHDVESAIAHRREGELQFGLAFDGLAEQPETGEGRGEGGESSLHVQPFSPTDGPLYLFGNAWDRFDGRSWSQAETAEEDVELLAWNTDTLEHVYALWRWQQAHGAKDDERFFRGNHIYISYGGMNTRTMFSAMNALHFYYDEQRYPAAAGSGGILFDYMQDNGTAYRMYWLEANARTLGQLIAYSEGYDYDPAERRIWYTLKERYESRFHLDFRESAVLEELLDRRQALIEARDLDTEGVSPRAAALAETITSGCRSDYEKLRAIAAYLQQNYRYTLSPAPVPQGANFLDWLLFERKEGYCTWYATAAALLARSVGIPTRYVQGCRAGPLPTRRFTTLGPGTAHAWCEGYVTGYGWVTVEATPGFAGEGYGWVPPGEESRAVLPEEDLNPLPEKERKRVLTDEAEETVQLPGTGEPPEPEPETEEETRLWFLWLLPPALALLGAALWLLRRRRLRLRYLAAPPEEQARQDLGRLLGYLRRRGYPRAQEESIRACFAALPWRYLPAEREQAMAMADFYEEVLFGGRTPSPEELAAQRAFVDAFRPRRRRLFR